MACGDVLSLEDLQTAKKHQIFEAEVITGKAGGVAGGATIGTATNPVTGQTQQTLPSILADLGFDVQPWTSSTGGVLASANQVFLNDTPGSLGLGDYYAWGGTFPKTVPAGTNPALVGSGYIMRSSRLAGTQALEALRRSYAEAGYNLVDGSFEAGGVLVNASDVLLQARTGKAFSGPAGTVAAGTNPASGVFTDKSLSVKAGNTYSGIQSYSGPVNALTVGGSSVAGDGGAGMFIKDAADTTTPDDGGTTLVDALLRRWKRSYDYMKAAIWFGVSESSADVGPKMLKAMAGGGSIAVRDGQYNLLTVVKTNFSGAVFPVNGKKSIRYDVKGASKHNTTFNTNGNVAFWSIGDDYVAPGAENRGQGLYTAATWRDFCVYGTARTGKGLILEGQVGVTVKDLRFAQLDIAMEMKGAIVSDIENINTEFCNVGLALAEAPNSPINSVNFNRLKYGSCRDHAIKGAVGTRASFIGIDVESCGWGVNDAGGTVDTGGIRLDVTELISIVSFKDCYFEANEGLGDIIINNTRSTPVIVKIADSTFIRGNKRGRGCKNVINVSSTGGGEVILVLSACVFLSTPTFGYVISASEPVISPHPKLRVYGMETCMFSDRVNVSPQVVGASGLLAVKVAADGSKTMGPGYLTPSRVGTGIYRVSSTLNLGNDKDSYTVYATPGITGYSIDAITLNNILLEVRTYNAAGVLTDCPFSLGIAIGVGEGR